MHVGCCSYSPVFSLFEIYQMMKDGNRDIFMEMFYGQKAATIKPYEITVHAEVHSLFDKQSVDSLSSIEKEDLRLQYSVCQFFEPQKGCSLPANYKNATCRSFICLTIEDQLDDEAKVQLKEWNTNIHQEVHSFVKEHQRVLEQKGINLQNNVHAVLDYLEQQCLILQETKNT